MLYIYNVVYTLTYCVLTGTLAKYLADNQMVLKGCLSSLHIVMFQFLLVKEINTPNNKG